MVKYENVINIENKYQVFFDELIMIPKADRYRFFLNHKDYDEMIIDIMKEFGCGAYHKLLKKLNNVEQESQNMHVFTENDFDMANSKKFEADWLVFMETIKITIEGYKPIDSKGRNLLFITQLRKIYKQCVVSEVGKNEYLNESKGLTGEITDNKKKWYIIKLIKEVKRLKYVLNDKRSYEELVYDVISGRENISIKHNFSKEEIQDAIVRIRNLSVFSYFDATFGEDNLTLKDTYGEYDNEFDRIDTGSLIDDFWNVLVNNAEKGLKRVALVVGKEDLDIIKAVLTKDILIALKLMEIPEGEQWEPEPNCGHWCPKKKICMDKGKGCYIRYSEVKKQKPYGNEILYALLKKQEVAIYDKLIHHRYADSAVENSNLEDLFINKLYPYPNKGIGNGEKTFDFSDQILSDVLRIDKTKLSKFRNTLLKKSGKTKEQLMREELKRIFYEVQNGN